MVRILVALIHAVYLAAPALAQVAPFPPAFATRDSFASRAGFTVSKYSRERGATNSPPMKSSYCGSMRAC